MTFLGYEKGIELEFNYKKSCGLWLIAVSLVILVATFVGGSQIINMPVFSFGYVICFLGINLNKNVLKNFLDGPSSKFQDKVASYSVILLFILMFLIGGPFFPSENWRLVWSGALMATALHFFPYYFVHGKSMMWLGLLCVVNMFGAYLLPTIPFEIFVYGDVAIKFGFGVYLLFFSKPTANRI